MAREVITWCDVHLNEHDGERVPGDEITIGVGNQKPRLLALCPPCKKELVEPLTHALSEYGVIVDRVKVASPSAPAVRSVPTGTGRQVTQSEDKWAQPNESGVFPCLYPGCDMESVSYPGLSQHVRNSHGLKWSDYRRLCEGEITLADLGMEPVGPETLPNPLPCGIDDCQREFKGTSRKGGRSGHIKRTHPGWTYEWPPKKEKA